MAKATGSFADSSAHAARIIEDLSQGIYAPLYLLHGTEGYFIDQIEGYITAHALSDDLRDLNQITLWGKETSGGEIVAAARQYPMMGGRQVVVVRDASAVKELETIVSYIKKPSQSTVLVICHRDKSMDKRSVLYKKFAAETSAVIFESIPAREWDVAKFVGQIFTAKGLTADAAAMQMIADHIGTNLTQIDTELTKLATRLAPVTSVRAKDIEENIGISKDFNNFELTKALSTRNFKAALTIANHLSDNPKANPLVVTISTLFTHFQRIATLNLYKWDCARKGKAIGNDYELAKLLGLQSSFFLSEYQTAAANYPTPKVVEIMGLVREWDMRSKGFSQSMATDGELLNELILRISMV
ncbi:MAG: DNA polymerase III subunit delta [Mucinivorans sp.]